MKVPLTSPHQHVRIGPRPAGSAKGCIVAAATLLAVSLLGTSAQATNDPPVTITILLYNYAQVPPATLAAAEREANKILATAGAQIDWVHCLPISAPDASELCRRGWTPQTPGLRLITGANKFQDAQLGYTAIPVLVTVYYEKVLRRAQRDNFPAQLPSLLGCVIAHELGHLLLQAPGHSTRGIMQPQWSAVQIRQALMGTFQFSHEEAVRIQSQARILASLPRSPAQQSVTP
jgi:hypothetical protein